jgi:conjugal transfer pilus assembly protein TrbC
MARRYELDGPSEDGTIDLASMLGDAARIADARMAEPGPTGVIVLASFSMPEASLRELVSDARRAGVPVMLRGFAEGSLSETAKRMRELLEGPVETRLQETGSLLGGVVVDPRAFRIFAVEDVPVFIASAGPLPDCDGLSCTAPPPPHDRIAGNMSLGAALRALASEGTAAPQQAKAVLLRLEAPHE